jgi:hypothetical protein
VKRWRFTEKEVIGILWEREAGALARARGVDALGRQTRGAFGARLSDPAAFARIFNATADPLRNPGPIGRWPALPRQCHSQTLAINE